MTAEKAWAVAVFLEGNGSALDIRGERQHRLGGLYWEDCEKFGLVWNASPKQLDQGEPKAMQKGADHDVSRNIKNRNASQSSRHQDPTSVGFE
jgi:hypothetical protein